jgi:hypothetical protein
MDLKDHTCVIPLMRRVWIRKLYRDRKWVSGCQTGSWRE